MEIYSYYAIYIIFTLLVLKFRSPSLHSILTLFIVYCFLAYGLASVYFRIYPESSFIASFGDKIDYRRMTPFYPKAFQTFLFGYISFIFGFLITNKISIKSTFKTKSTYNFWIVCFLFFVANWGSFLFRYHFHAGVVYYREASYKFANYLYYSFDYLSLILVTILFYQSLLEDKKSYFFASLFSGINYGLALLLLGWKSGFIYVSIIFGHVFLFNKKQNKAKSLRIKKYVYLSVIAVLIISLLLFKIMPGYRTQILSQKKSFEFSTLIAVLDNQVFENRIKVKVLANRIINRITGINALLPTVVLVDPSKAKPISFISNIFSRGSYQPESYFGERVLKVTSVQARGIMTFAPTGWGTFYIYYGNIGVVLGFLIIGILAAIFENTMILYVRNSYEFIALYSIVYAVIFPSVVFEGTVIFFLKRHFLSLLLVFTLFKLFDALKDITLRKSGAH